MFEVGFEVVFEVGFEVVVGSREPGPR